MSKEISQEAAKLLLEACKEFVRKVDSGEARSKNSYAQMKEAISMVEDTRLTEEEKNLLHNIYAKLWTEVYYDPENEKFQKFCKPLVDMMDKLNKTLNFWK